MPQGGLTRVKICCIASVAEAQLAIRYGANAVGLVSAMPSGPGPIPEDLIAEFARTIPPGVASVLLTSRQDVAGIVDQQRRCGVNTLQLVDAMTPDDLKKLRTQLPGIAILQVVHVTGPEAVHQATLVAPFVNGILLDSGNPRGAVKELGGTGRQHDWNLSRTIVEKVAVPVYLAGGLRPENVADAIRQVRPFGVDVCSGLRTEGELDEEKLGRFMEGVAAAQRQLRTLNAEL
jgi:phosphoribosylanthranilate isomerase